MSLITSLHSTGATPNRAAESRAWNGPLNKDRGDGADMSCSRFIFEKKDGGMDTSVKDRQWHADLRGCG
ncbi:hypothetical protein GSbR_11800 [Geobacter sp. SVR]|nr:hypothetical protein GSVR_15030 [Geobacter sp. SVR]GCF84580.1 hypothetical protein GSbR_11800 [Geobacter sp. SVR]